MRREDAQQALDAGREVGEGRAAGQRRRRAKLLAAEAVHEAGQDAVAGGAPQARRQRRVGAGRRRPHDRAVLPVALLAELLAPRDRAPARRRPRRARRAPLGAGRSALLQHA